jgi:heme/copper-type cytochrome/quinol oxidase subunit 3
MPFYISAVLFFATVVYLYASSTMTRTGGGDALGDELGLYLWASIALILGVVMGITGWLKIKSPQPGASEFLTALPILIMAVAVGLSIWTYVQITTSSGNDAETSVEVR